MSVEPTNKGARQRSWHDRQGCSGNSAKAERRQAPGGAVPRPAPSAAALRIAPNSGSNTGPVRIKYRWALGSTRRKFTRAADFDLCNIIIFMPPDHRDRHARCLVLLLGFQVFPIIAALYCLPRVNATPHSIDVAKIR
jgi:hypothetical protein